MGTTKPLVVQRIRLLTRGFASGTPNGIRTRAATLRGWCPRPLDDGGEIFSCAGEKPSRVSSGGRTRTPNDWTRTSCVTDYTTPERVDGQTSRGRPILEKRCGQSGVGNAHFPIRGSAGVQLASRSPRRAQM